MTTFDDREKAFENKFIHDEELKFKVEARRSKLVGLWAAGILGRTGDKAVAYAREVVAADISERGAEDVFRKLSTDLGGLADAATIRAQMGVAMDEAKRQLMNE
mgnify:CR=1 FL=1